MRLSALEQIPLFAGRTPRRAIEDTVRLARGLEDSGYHRFWIAEHHNTSAFVSSAPDLLMMHMLDATDRIRVGSGGIMAMHYGSLQIAERFATLATLFPGRVDLGLGRAPGGDMLAARALNQGRFIAPEAIDALIDETVALLRDELPAGHRYAALGVHPAPEVLPELWLLGSSGQSAAWAGAHDLGYAYAQFFTGRQQIDVMNHYRAHLPQGASSDRTLSAMCVSAAPTRDEAREQALTSGWRCARGVQWASARLMRSAPGVGRRSRPTSSVTPRSSSAPTTRSPRPCAPSRRITARTSSCSSATSTTSRSSSLSMANSLLAWRADVGGIRIHSHSSR